MSIQARLDDDLKTAMRGRDEVAKGTIRLIKAAVQNAEIEKGSTLDDAGVTGVLSRMARGYREAIELYRRHGRDDIAAREDAELAVLMRYMPAQLGRDQVLAMAKRVAEDVGALGPADRGRVMGALMPQLRGVADGSMVNGIVGELLESLASA